VGTDDHDDGGRLPGLLAPGQFPIGSREKVGPRSNVIGVERELCEPGSHGIDDGVTRHPPTGETPSAIGDDHDEGGIVLHDLRSVFGARSGRHRCHCRHEPDVHRGGETPSATGTFLGEADGVAQQRLGSATGRDLDARGST